MLKLCVTVHDPVIISSDSISPVVQKVSVKFSCKRESAFEKKSKSGCLQTNGRTIGQNGRKFGID